MSKVEAITCFDLPTCNEIECTLIIRSKHNSHHGSTSLRVLDMSEKGGVTAPIAVYLSTTVD